MTVGTHHLRFDAEDTFTNFYFLHFFLGGWRIIDDALSQWNLKKWSIKESLPILHEKYGISLFFKISMRDRDTVPYGKIISISEGDFGLPNKDLYLIDESSEVSIHKPLSCKDNFTKTNFTHRSFNPIWNT